MAKTNKVSEVIPNIDENTIAIVECSYCGKDIEVNFIQHMREKQMQGKSHRVICKKCKEKIRRNHD